MLSLESEDAHADAGEDDDPNDTPPPRPSLYVDAPTDTDGPVAKPKRTRKHVSCEGCRQRKVKCSREQTCTNCRLRNQPCIYIDAEPLPVDGSVSHEEQLHHAHQEIDRLRAEVAHLTAERQREPASSPVHPLEPAGAGIDPYALAPHHHPLVYAHGHGHPHSHAHAVQRVYHGGRAPLDPSGAYGAGGGGSAQYAAPGSPSPSPSPSPSHPRASAPPPPCAVPPAAAPLPLGSGWPYPLLPHPLPLPLPFPLSSPYAVHPRPFGAAIEGYSPSPLGAAAVGAGIGSASASAGAGAGAGMYPGWGLGHAAPSGADAGAAGGGVAGEGHVGARGRGGTPHE